MWTHARGVPVRRIVAIVAASTFLAASCGNGTSSDPGAGGDPVIAAAGDIACDPADPNFNGGAGTSDACAQQRTSDVVVSANPTAVLVLGDAQYDCGGDAAFQASYAPSWGRLKDITHPVPGNQEYNGGGPDCDPNSQAAGYFRYFGPAAGPAGEGYYSFDIGAWHMIALNADCGDVPGGCEAGSPQETWLKADLAANPSTCTLAFWHQPRFSSGSNGDEDKVAPFWDDLFAAGADVVLNGHDHGYERFAPQDPNREPDPSGPREFVVGSGGDDHGGFSGSPDPNSEVRDDTSFGVLFLTLHSAGYDWQFRPAAGASFTDAGTGGCH